MRAHPELDEEGLEEAFYEWYNRDYEGDPKVYENILRKGNSLSISEWINGSMTDFTKMSHEEIVAGLHRLVKAGIISRPGMNGEEDAIKDVGDLGGSVGTKDDFKEPGIESPDDSIYQEDGDTTTFTAPEMDSKGYAGNNGLASISRYEDPGVSGLHPDDNPYHYSGEPVGIPTGPSPDFTFGQYSQPGEQLPWVKMFSDMIPTYSGQDGGYAQILSSVDSFNGANPADLAKLYYFLGGGKDRDFDWTMGERGQKITQDWSSDAMDQYQKGKQALMNMIGRKFQSDFGVDLAEESDLPSRWGEFYGWAGYGNNSFDKSEPQEPVIPRWADIRKAMTIQLVIDPEIKGAEGSNGWDVKQADEYELGSAKKRMVNASHAAETAEKTSRDSKFRRMARDKAEAKKKEYMDQMMTTRANDRSIRSQAATPEGMRAGHEHNAKISGEINEREKE